MLGRWRAKSQNKLENASELDSDNEPSTKQSERIESQPIGHRQNKKRGGEPRSRAGQVEPDAEQLSRNHLQCSYDPVALEQL